MRYFSAPLILLFIFLQTPHAHAGSFISGTKQVVLVELYTSEGCSSCPPADQWVSGLSRQSDLWGRFVVLGFHVNYWDYLGWQDRFADEQYVERQRQYAEVWKTGTLYTPAVVVNGMPWKGWHSEKSVPSVARPEVGDLRIQSSDGRSFRYDFRPAEGIARAGFDAYFAVVGFGLDSDVKRGENSGRRLQHDFVVLQLQRADMKFDGTSASVEFVVDSARPLPEKTGVVGWITYHNNPAPLQATGGPLSE